MLHSRQQHASLLEEGSELDSEDVVGTIMALHKVSLGRTLYKEFALYPLSIHSDGFFKVSKHLAEFIKA